MITAVTTVTKTIANVTETVINMRETNSMKRVIMKIIINKIKSSASMIETIKMLMKVNQFVMMNETYDIIVVKL